MLTLISCKVPIKTHNTVWIRWHNFFKKKTIFGYNILWILMYLRGREALLVRNGTNLDVTSLSKILLRRYPYHEPSRDITYWNIIFSLWCSVARLDLFQLMLCDFETHATLFVLESILSWRSWFHSYSS